MSAGNFPMMIALAKPTASVDAATVDGDAKTCPVFNAHLKIFDPAPTASPTSLALRPFTQQTYPILNTLTRELSSTDEVPVGRLPDGRWATLQSGGGTGVHMIVADVASASSSGAVLTMTVASAYNGDAKVAQFQYDQSGIAKHNWLLEGEKGWFFWDETAEKYQFEDVHTHKADWVLVTLSIPGGYSAGLLPGSVAGFFEGISPGSTVYVDVALWGKDCEEPESVQGWARFVPESIGVLRKEGHYTLMNTESAFMGAAVKKEVATGPVQRSPFSGMGQFCITQATEEIYTYTCSNDNSGSGLSGSFDSCFYGSDFYKDTFLCQWICDNCEQFANDPDCNPDCGDCCDCEINELTNLTLNIGGVSWTFVSASDSDSCSWDVVVEDGNGNEETYRVAYNCCGEWTVTGQSFEGTGTGDCTGATVTDGGDTATISVDGQACSSTATDNSGCCDLSSSSYVEALNLVWDDGCGNSETIEVSMPAGDRPQISDCTFSTRVTIEINDLIADPSGNPTIIEGNARGEYDDANGWWLVEVEPTSIPIASCGDVSISPTWIEESSQANSCNGGDDCPASKSCPYSTQLLSIVDPCEGGPQAMSMPMMITGTSPMSHYTSERPGTRLAEDVAPEVFAHTKCTSCKDVVKLMDRWGCGESTKRLDELVRHFRRAAAKSKIAAVRAYSDHTLKHLILRALTEEVEKNVDDRPRN